ncbi:hypothetical protein [Pseudomonas fluorescens]|uniref:hypothetical protein n=1 Tax=Pseudomonas fluorescens TaxID=294 RepID=UPI000CA343D5|nr:hypothetical protein [Pseudomonas fluorescens]AUM71222.1 hypothetical protein C0J56_21790 [Pseudomonas fluorescens]
MNIFSPYLFPPLDLESRRLVVGPVMLTGLVKPVVGGDGGVNIEMLKHPVLCQIDPYSLDMAENDQIKIYWDDTEVGDITVRDVDVGERLSVFLLVEPIVRGWAEKVFFRVTPATSPTPIDSPISRLWVKLDPPGGRDIHPGNPIGHSQLKSPVLPPELDMVDAEWAARGIPLKIENYDFRTVRDLIQLKWGSTTVRRLVTEDEANSTDPITIMIDQDIILAGGDGNSVLVHYMVFDEVWNPSSRYSQRTHVKVEAGASRLDPPIIQETDSDDVIDLDLLEKEDVTVQIYVSSPTFSLNDTLTMIWTGTPFIGSPLINTQSETLTNLPKVLQFKIPNAEIRAIAQGSGDVWYKLDKANGDPPQSSKHAFAYVIGDPTLLPAPTIVELIGDTLDPTLPWAIVQIPVYPGMDNGDLIDMVWFGTTATNDPYPHEQGHPVTEGEVGTVIEIPVTGEHIIALNNGTLDLFYRVSRDDVWLYGVKESDHLAVKVQAIQADLPKPRVIEAPDDILDHELFTGPVTLRIDYLGTAVGDELTYYWLGNPGSGSHSDSLPITTLQAGEPVNFRIARELVEANINSVVKVRYTLKHVATGKYSYSAVLDLLIGELLGELPPPKVLEAPDDVLDPMDALNGVTVRVSYESMDTPHLIHLNWQGTPGDGSSDDQELPGSTSGSVEFKVDAAVVGANIDRAVLVDYTVEHRGFSFISESRALTVSNFSDPDTQLPHPLIPQADQARQVLNLATFTGNAEVTVAKWPFSVVGQKVWLYLEGQTDGDAAYTISLLAGTAISDAQASSGLRETLLRSELEKLGHGTPLTVIFKVIFTGEDDEFYAVEFPRAQYTFKVRHDWVVPEIQRLEDTWGISSRAA